MKQSAAEWADKRASADQQTEAFNTARLHKDTVEAKLFPEWQGTRAASFAKCGREKLYRECRECGATEVYDYHCNLKWCPCCNWRVTFKRAMELRYLTEGMSRLKHLVLTQRNFGKLRREHIVATRKNLAKLRASKLFAGVVGGCNSLEFTNEKAGWHMHWHLLLEGGFIPQDEISAKWAKYVGQEFAICFIKAVGKEDYVKEVSKYVVEGSEIAKWSREQILEFVTALDATRLFSIFGRWKELRPAARAKMNEDRPMPTCECGCIHFLYGDDECFIRREINGWR